jgi:hypothetical protein
MIDDRVTFLEELAKLAAVAATLTEVAKHLDMTGPKLRTILDTDQEAQVIWAAGRRALFVKSRESLQVAAAEGRRYAQKILADVFANEGSQRITPWNPRKLSVDQLAEISGRSRQTIWSWRSKHGLPQNPDGTHDLLTFLVWFEKFVIAKVLAGRTEGSDHE